MMIIPAIDLIGGKCVRLRQGSYADTTVYDADPIAVAQRFADAGAPRIHLVDLDAARGSGDNRAVIRRIAAAVGCELEVGGGVRTRDALHEVLALGVDFAIVGTILARAPEEVATWAEQEAGRIIASIDARDGKVQVSGWREGTDVSAGTLARYAGEIGLAAVEYTNIARDGMLQGPDIEGTLAVARETDIPVILSGGVSSTEDAEHVRRLSGDALAGIIVGRALYEGTFNLEAAIARTA